MPPKTGFRESVLSSSIWLLWSSRCLVHKLLHVYIKQATVWQLVQTHGPSGSRHPDPLVTLVLGLEFLVPTALLVDLSGGCHSWTMGLFFDNPETSQVRVLVGIDHVAGIFPPSSFLCSFAFMYFME